MNILKKVLLYFIVPLAVVVVALLAYISYGFGKLEFEDTFTVEGDYSTYYPESYESAREQFRHLAEDISLQYQGVRLSQIYVPSKIDDDLTIDICYIPARNDSTSLLILSSGVHGVEGFVGHAAQQLFIRKYLNDSLLVNTGILLIHSVNPYGFKYTRRVTENNVDLNRNSPSTENLYQTVNEGYPKVYDLVNPKGKVERGSLGNRLFFVTAVNEIRKASMPVLRQAVLQGQYQYKEGLYFGGMNPEPQIESMKTLLSAYTAPYENILVLDLHTGYGERGKLHFFPNPVEDDKKEKMEKLFEGYTIDWGDSDDFYTVTGDFASYIGAMNPGKDFYPMLIEYGTMNSQTTMGSLKSIHIMILENQGQQYGFSDAKDSLMVKKDILEMYYPSSPLWRNYVLQQTDQVFNTILPRFAGLSQQ